MKKSDLLFVAAGFVLMAFSSCSSTSTESADTAVTTETVTPDVAATEPATSQPVTPTDTAATAGAATGTLSEDPTNFVLLAGSLDLLETQSSKQALTRALNPEVKNYAQQVLSEHSKISQELRGLATAKKLKYPVDILPKHQLYLNRLMEEEPKEFDKTYMELQEAAHSELEELFEDGSKRHSDPEMMTFASRNLTAIRMQLESTKKVKDIVD